MAMGVVIISILLSDCFSCSLRGFECSDVLTTVADSRVQQAGLGFDAFRGFFGSAGCGGFG